MTATEPQAEARPDTHTNGAEAHPEPPKPTNIIEALARCIAEMPAIGKDQQMGNEGSSQSYKYRSIEAITSHASALFGKYGIVPKPHKIRREVKDIRMGSGSTVWTEDTMYVRYRLYGPGGVEDFITTAEFVALARDNSDKGTNKAMTQAFKQMLLQVLMVGDNKDDPDSYSPAGGNQDERTVPPTVDDWARENGWPNGEADLKAMAEKVKDALARLVSVGDLERPEANERWKSYLHPDPEQPERVIYRTRADFDSWWADNIGLPVDDEPEAPQAAPDPDSPPEAHTPEPAPGDPPAGAQAPQEPAQDQPPPEPTQPTLDETPPVGDPNRPLPADNEFRDVLDQLLEDGNIDDLVAQLKDTAVPDIVQALRNRGDDVEGTHPGGGEQLRKRLVAILVRNKAGAPAERRSKSRSTRSK